MIQEEIREGIYNIILDCEEPDGVDANRAVQLITQYLHSQGVVLKVEGKLPEIVFPMHIGSDSPIGHIAREWHKKTQEDMLEAGYVKTEPLIEVR